MKKFFSVFFLVGLLFVSSFSQAYTIDFSVPKHVGEITPCEPLPFTYEGYTYTQCYSLYNALGYNSYTTNTYYNPGEYLVNSYYHNVAPAIPLLCDSTSPPLFNYSEPTYVFGVSDYLVAYRYDNLSSFYDGVTGHLYNNWQYIPTSRLNSTTNVNLAVRWSYTPPIPPLPLNRDGLTYTQKAVGFNFDGTAEGYERELYTPAGSGIWINHSGQDPYGDSLATGVFTGNASETISAHDGVLDNSGFYDNIKLNETMNCFATIKSNVDIKWTTQSQYGNTDNCGNYHQEGDLVVEKNLNTDGTVSNSCISPLSCTFPDFTNTGANIRDKNNASDFVHMMDALDGVPSFLNSKNNVVTESYYQCTEYVERYLHSRFNTDYSDRKNINDTDTQGFRGNNFHPNYGGTPTVGKNGVTKSLAPVSLPKAGDVAMFSSGHSAIVKSISETTATLIEQNYIVSGKYASNRTVDTLASGTAFYRYPAVVIEGTSTVSSTVQDAYDSAMNDQSIKMQTQVFNENLNFSKDIFVTLSGGYDPTFQTASGMTTIFGSLTITSGTLVVDGICIQ